jgi:hypothetical protein
MYQALHAQSFVRSQISLSNFRANISLNDSGLTTTIEKTKEQQTA